MRVTISIPEEELKKKESVSIEKQELPQSVREVLNVFKGELKENPAG